MLNVFIIPVFKVILLFWLLNFLFLWQDADKEIQKVLKQRGRLVVQSTIVHQYPFCWRSHTPLIYRAIPVWFVRVTSAIEKLVANNEETRW